MEKTFFSENHLRIDFQNCFQLLVDFRGITSIFPISSAAFASSWRSFPHVVPTIKNVRKLCVNLDFIILLNTYYWLRNYVPYPQYIRKYTRWVSFVGFSPVPTPPSRANSPALQNPYPHAQTYALTPFQRISPTHTLSPSNSVATHTYALNLHLKEYLPPHHTRLRRQPIWRIPTHTHLRPQHPLKTPLPPTHTHTPTLSTPSNESLASHLPTPTHLCPVTL